MVRIALARRRALSLAKAISMGLRSGLVGRQEQEPGALGANGRFCGGAFMGGQVVQDDDVARLKGWNQLGLDVSLEDAPIHRRVDDEWRGERPAAQAGYEGLRLPVAERGL